MFHRTKWKCLEYCRCIGRCIYLVWIDTNPHWLQVCFGVYKYVCVVYPFIWSDDYPKSSLSQSDTYCNCGLMIEKRVTLYEMGVARGYYWTFYWHKLVMSLGSNVRVLINRLILFQLIRSFLKRFWNDWIVNRRWDTEWESIQKQMNYFKIINVSKIISNVFQIYLNCN